MARQLEAGIVHRERLADEREQELDRRALELFEHRVMLEQEQKALVESDSGVKALRKELAAVRDAKDKAIVDVRRGGRWRSGECDGCGYRRAWVCCGRGATGLAPLTCGRCCSVAQRREALRELSLYKAGVEAEAEARQQAFIRAASQEQPSAGEAATMRQELEATKAALAHARAQVSDLQAALRAAAEVGHTPDATWSTILGVTRTWPHHRCSRLPLLALLPQPRRVP